MGDGVKGKRLELWEAVSLVRPRDTILCGLATGQPTGLLEVLGARTDLEAVDLYCGILVRPYAFLQNPAVRVVSGFFGPVERMARAAGARVDFLPADFHGLERLALRMRPRVVVATTTPPDADGFLSFGLHAGASYRAFVEAARDPARVAIAEVNPRLPRIDGLEEFGRNRIHVSEVDAWAEFASDPITLPPEELTPEDEAIAGFVAERVEDGSTLQFGIGAAPDEIAGLLAKSPRGGFGVHTEMISDGIRRLHEAGKVENRKGLYDGFSVATFALGSAELYRWLDQNPVVRMLPVSAVNEPALLRRLQRFVSVNGALAIDLRGQVAADSVRGAQYSGIGGHESFVMGASEAPGGKSFVCLKSTTVVRATGERVSTIVHRLPAEMTVTTPRHHVQWVVTEQGAVDLSTLTDRERVDALIEIAHPDFRDSLREQPGARKARGGRR